MTSSLTGTLVIAGGRIHLPAVDSSGGLFVSESADAGATWSHRAFDMVGAAFGNRYPLGDVNDSGCHRGTSARGRGHVDVRDLSPGHALARIHTGWGLHVRATAASPGLLPDSVTAFTAPADQLINAHYLTEFAGVVSTTAPVPALLIAFFDGTYLRVLRSIDDGARLAVAVRSLSRVTRSRCRACGSSRTSCGRGRPRGALPLAGCHFRSAGSGCSPRETASRRSAAACGPAPRRSSPAPAGGARPRCTRPPRGAGTRRARAGCPRAPASGHLTRGDDARDTERRRRRDLRRFGVVAVEHDLGERIALDGVRAGASADPLRPPSASSTRSAGARLARAGARPASSPSPDLATPPLSAAASVERAAGCRRRSRRGRRRPRAPAGGRRRRAPVAGPDRSQRLIESSDSSPHPPYGRRAPSDFMQILRRDASEGPC